MRRGTYHKDTFKDEDLIMPYCDTSHLVVTEIAISLHEAFIQVKY